MIVKSLEGFVCIIWQDTPEGYTRGLPLTYIGLDPKLALALGEELIKQGKELLNAAENTRTA